MGIGCSMLSHVSLAKIQIWLDFNRFHDTGCQIFAIGLRMLNHLVRHQEVYRADGSKQSLKMKQFRNRSRRFGERCSRFCSCVILTVQ